MPSLRDQLRARRATYLERIAVFDVHGCHEPYDIRVASVRGFLEGGDDVPPECEEKGTRPERLRLPSYIVKEEREAAIKRLQGPKNAQPSDASDWDQFLRSRDGGGETRLFRIIAQLVFATEYFRKGVVTPKHQVLELFVSELPSPSSTSESVQSAWHLLRVCGGDQERLRKSYLRLIEDVGPIKTPWLDVTEALPRVVDAWINSFGGRNGITDGQKCPPGPKPAERVWKQECPCQRKPPDPPELNDEPRPQPPTLDSVRAAAREAVAAARLNGDQAIIDEFKFIQMSELMIAQILQWLADKWSEVPEVMRTAVATGTWYPRHPETDPHGLPNPRNVYEQILFSNYRDYWEEVKLQLGRVRKVPQHFIALSQKNVGEVCAGIFKSLWPDDDDAPYDEQTLEKSGITREHFLGAVDRAVANSPDDGPFHLIALLNEPEGYIRVLENVGPAGEDGTGANGLARPTLTPVSAFYWRNVIVPSTVGHILTQADTADFHIAHHLRLLGLFRVGGKYRTGKPEDAEYERYISELLPDWVLRFITAALLRVKYWLDDPPLERPSGEEMTYWSENHQMLFASAEYILPSFFPNEMFAYTNQSANWHRERALARLRTWLDHRLQFGYSEVNSAVYYNQHLPGLLNLVDFSPGDEIRKKALIALDLMIFDVVRRVCQGSFVAASGRQYWGGKRSGWSGSIIDTIELLTGSIGDFWGTNESSAISFVTSRYIDEIPEALLAIAHDTAPRIDRSRTSINIEESEKYGIDPESSSGIVFWWGNGAYFTEETYRASQSWSYRWGLRKSGPFRIFAWIDEAIIRLIMAVFNLLASMTGLVVTALSQQFLSGVLGYFSGLLSKVVPTAVSGPSMMYGGGFPITLLNGAMTAPLVLRRLLDVVLSVLDVFIGVAARAMKEVGLLDENDDRVRVAYPALEQEFRELAIAFNAGSLLERQHLYGWRSRDAMLTTMADNHKGGTSFQGEPCVASLGMNVSVFTGKRPHTGDEHGFWDQFGQAMEGYYVKGVARYAYDPEVFFTSQLGLFDGETSPEWGSALTPFAAGALFGDDGPGYWFGNLSLPMVYQNENVAISIYSPTDLQDDLGPEETHAHWPFDHFDEVITDERNGGRWVFGRRDQRFPPRTPCEPGAGRPTKEQPWPSGKRREERGMGSGYVALFSARGMKTLPGTMYGHRELVADGHDNIWITIVGDRATYHSFAEFREDVLAATLSIDMENRRCSIAMPDPGSAKSGQKGKTFAVSWEDGATIGGEKMDTGTWPRFEWKRSTMQSQRPPASMHDLRVDHVMVTSKADPAKGRVDWDEKSWRIEAKVRAWEEREKNGEKKWVEKSEVLFLEHDFEKSAEPKREQSREEIQAIHPSNTTASVTDELAATRQASEKVVESILGKRFRDSRRSVFQLRK